jgi:DNA damage-inducible protein 1
MCLVPCTIGDITVEMLVDTGAQGSVMSSPLVRELGLYERIDTRYRGIAAGVGRAKISGLLGDVACRFGNGHVEFTMEFMVLDTSDRVAIMGLDQLRKYNCLIDVGGNGRLIFGGIGGVEVDMLPPNASRFDVNPLDRGCALM